MLFKTYDNALSFTEQMLVNEMETQEELFNIERKALMVEHQLIMNEGYNEVLMEEEEQLKNKSESFFTRIIEKIKAAAAALKKWVQEKLSLLKSKISGKKIDTTVEVEVLEINNTDGIFGKLKNIASSFVNKIKGKKELSTDDINFDIFEASGISSDAEKALVKGRNKQKLTAEQLIQKATSYLGRVSTLASSAASVVSIIEIFKKVTDINPGSALAGKFSSLATKVTSAIATFKGRCDVFLQRIANNFAAKAMALFKSGDKETIAKGKEAMKNYYQTKKEVKSKKKDEEASHLSRSNQW